ncbi:hypothetical protein [Streptomyces canus]|uniref:hypothetical protein n=1 Tax=Streptomyces canus TaxID=58343 RepID=UPI0030DED5F4
MNAFLTVTAFIVLIAAAAYVIHRLNIEHADRIAVHRYSAPLLRRSGRATPQPPVGPRSGSPTAGERRDHRDEGHGRFLPRRHRSRTAHHR